MDGFAVPIREPAGLVENGAGSAWWVPADRLDNRGLRFADGPHGRATGHAAAIENNPPEK